jgi:hypothetical protein
VRYITHAFAHPETLERMQRLLVLAGFDRSRIQVHSNGTPRLAVAVEPGEAAEVHMIIGAVERSDPDGLPSFLNHARGPYVLPTIAEAALAETPQPRADAFVVGWRPLDDVREVVRETSDLHLREAYLERGE